MGAVPAPIKIKMGPSKHGDKTRKSRNTRILGGSNPAGCRLNRLVLRSVDSRESTSSPLGLVTENLHNNMHAQTQKRKDAILAKLLSVGMRRGEGGKTENEGPP